MREKQVVISLRLNTKLKASMDVAAEASGLGFTDWTRAVLALAANQGAFMPRVKGGRRAANRRRRT